MEKISLDSLREGSYFKNDLFIDSTFLLLPKTAEVSDSLIKALRVWGFDQFLIDSSAPVNNIKEQTSTGSSMKIEFPSEEEESKSSKEKIGESVKKAIESSKKAAVGNSDQARMDMVRAVYEEYMNYIESVFTHYATHKEIDQDELSETVKELCIFIKEHRRYILRVNATIEAQEKNFLVIHSMRTTVLAIAISLQLHLPLSKMIELGVTCILHEIGMLRLPPQLYMTSKKLSTREKAQISKHTLLGYSIIKDLNFNLSIQLGVLEHHEKENGTGYPRRLTGEKISSNAKIIAVACTYEAISSPRSYKDERSTFDALLEMVQNKEHAYDGAVIKGLLYTVSLYPIGSYVYLTNRKIAEVIDTNPDNPKTPVVQLLTEREKDGSLKVLQTGENNISILRILSKQEKEDILKIVKEKYQMIENASNVSSDENEKTETKEKTAEPQAKPVEPQVKEKPQKSSDQDIKATAVSQSSEASNPQENPKQQDSNSPEGTEEIDISIFG